MISHSGLAAVVLTLMLSGCLTGCALSRGEAFDPVSGNWTGAWYRAGETEPAGRLSFRLTSEGDETWRMVVEAASEVEAVYEFTLRGRREGARVVFGGEVDLGRAGGGVYEWTGEADGQVFQGAFSHPAGDGRFELVRRPEAESIVPADASRGDSSEPDES